MSGWPYPFTVGELMRRADSLDRAHKRTERRRLETWQPKPTRARTNTAAAGAAPAQAGQRCLFCGAPTGNPSRLCDDHDDLGEDL